MALRLHALKPILLVGSVAWLLALPLALSERVLPDAQAFAAYHSSIVLYGAIGWWSFGDRSARAASVLAVVALSALLAWATLVDVRVLAGGAGVLAGAALPWRDDATRAPAARDDGPST